MIPYEDLERALARWKAKAPGTTLDSAPPGEAGAHPPPPKSVNGVRSSSELSGEIDINELVESYDE